MGCSVNCDGTIEFDCDDMEGGGTLLTCDLKAEHPGEHSCHGETRRPRWVANKYVEVSSSYEIKWTNRVPA